MPGVEGGTVITVLTVDEALQHVCATLREHADRGDITPAERDLLIDGAILLAMRVDDLAQDGRVGWGSGWPEGRYRRALGGTNDTRSRQPPELTRRPGATQRWAWLKAIARRNVRPPSAARMRLLPAVPLAAVMLGVPALPAR